MPSYSEVSGFRGAPVTSLLYYTIFGGTFLAGLVPKLGAQLALASPAQLFSARPEVWRLFTSSLLMCDELGGAIVASFLLYRLRLFERQMGSSKFAAFVCLGTAVDSVARLGFLALPVLGARGVAAGPFQVVMGLMPLFYCA
jgi:membrane associated rhomboid family serine protease